MNVINVEKVPRLVLLFSGHMIDSPTRASPRFPPRNEAVARDAIVRLLAQLNAGPDDLAICGGACGGDLLFGEAALERSVPLELYLPFEPETFAVESVNFAGGNWHARFASACAASNLHVMPCERAALSGDTDPYQQNNLWMLESACVFGADKVHFICLWNGQGGDGPGGTQHLMHEVRNRQGQSHWLDTTKLWK